MPTTDLERLLQRAERVLERIEAWLPGPLAAPDWSAAVAFRYRRNAQGGALLEPIRNLAAIGLNDLRDIDAQKARLVRNTEQFLAGRPANNVLLTGARGTGKSSLVRACLCAYADRGLRLIEMDRTDLMGLPELAELVQARPERFIVYSDDLSFDEGDAAYKALKSVLDGGLAAGASNLLVYATSNRRHLLPEYMQDNERVRHGSDGEIHPGEAIEEKISLSERFGLWLSFYPFSQAEYLRIVDHWLQALGVGAEARATAAPEALVFALERGSRSGRVAHQFARDYAGRLAGADDAAAGTMALA